MGFLVIILLIVLGIIATGPMLKSKIPALGALVDGLTPYAGYVGIAGIVVAIIDLLPVVRSLAAIGNAPLWVVMGVVAWIALAGLSIIFGYGLLSEKLLSGNPDARAKGAEIQAKLLPFQTNLGIAALVIGLFFLLLTLMYS